MTLYIVEGGEVREDDGGYWGVLGLDWIPVVCDSPEIALAEATAYDGLSQDEGRVALAHAITESAKVGGQSFIDALREARGMREVRHKLPPDFVWPHLPEGTED
jgi:hypothetical protein